MQFVLIGYDGTDSEARERRLNARPLHLDKVRELKESGNFHFGGAILDDEEKMVGSVVIYEFPGWDEMEAYLDTEPYVTEGVWKKMDVKPFRLANI